MNNFLSVDPSLCGTGYAIMNMKSEIITYGEINTNNKMSIESRLYLIYNNMENIVNSYSPDCIILEKMFVNMNGQSSMNIAAVRGILLLLCGKHNIPVIEIMATTVRRVILGKGNSTKINIKHYITEYLAEKQIVLNKPSHNILDAIATGLYYVRCNG